MSNLARIQANLGAFDALLLTDPITIRYAASFSIEDGAAIITREKAFLITDSRYIEAATAAVPDMTVLCVSAEKPFKVLAQEILSKTAAARVGAEADRMTVREWAQTEAELGLSLEHGEQVIASLRPSKTEDELQCLIAAQRIAEKAFDELLGLIRPGLSEQELAAELIYRLYKFGGEGLSFPPIVIAGAKTSMPHGVPGKNILRPGDFITMDFGTIYGGYCSDMTRTVALDSVTDEMKKVYDTVLAAQLAGIDAAKPGVTGRDIDAAARRVIADAGYGAYFGHSFGHSLGLEIHESPNASPGNREPMPDGAVISAEPGIYLPGRFGVRIEDVLYLRNGGCLDITEAPKQLIIL